MQWVGYEGIADKYSWLGTLELANVVELVQELHAQYPEKPGPLSLLLS